MKTSENPITCKAENLTSAGANDDDEEETESTSGSLIEPNGSGEKGTERRKEEESDEGRTEMEGRARFAAISPRWLEVALFLNLECFVVLHCFPHFTG